MRVFITILIAGLLTCLPLSSQSKYEIRAAWLTTIGALDFPMQKANSPQGVIRQKRELCRILDKLKDARFNTVLLQTRLRGDVIYPSVFEGFAESLTGFTGRNPGYDLLKFAIAECHKRGMELHAWIVAIPIGNERQVKLQGKNAVTKKHPELCKKYKGIWYLDPGNPKTDDYLAGIVREIVSSYDIDGIHLDYIRYPEHPETFPDRALFRKYGKGKTVDQWRRDNITRIVRRLYDETKKLKPWIKVSSSPVGKYNDTPRYSSKGWNAFHTVYQDACQWMKEGIQDLIFPMMYFQRNSFYPFALDWNEHKSGRWVVPGLGIYFMHPDEQDWTLDEICRQISFTRENGMDGQAYFRTRFLLDNTKGLLDELKEQVYLHPAVVPPMTWEDSIPPSSPACPSFTAEGNMTRIEWKAPESKDNRDTCYYRIYASNSYPVDTDNIRNLQEARTDSTCYTFMPRMPWQQQLYWAITAVDRFGNESLPLALNTPPKGTDIVEGGLPDIPQGCILIISDAAGQELVRMPSSARVWPEKLRDGLFRLSLLHPDGQVETIGITLR